MLARRDRLRAFGRAGKASDRPGGTGGRAGSGERPGNPDAGGGQAGRQGRPSRCKGRAHMWAGRDRPVHTCGQAGLCTRAERERPAQQHGRAGRLRRVGRERRAHMARPCVRSPLPARPSVRCPPPSARVARPPVRRPLPALWPALARQAAAAKHFYSLEVLGFYSLEVFGVRTLTVPALWPALTRPQVHILLPARPCVRWPARLSDYLARPARLSG